jgi:hypothetical protein
MQAQTELTTKIARAAAPIVNGVRERMGGAIGEWIAPAVDALSRLRRARVLHPRGLAFAGRSEAIIGGAFASIGAQLDGRVLARCSGALWKRPYELFEVLGIALRFRPRSGPPLDEHPALGDQDLLFSTVRSPWLLPLAPLLTDARDFLANRFWGAAPYAIHDHDRVELRLEPVDPPVTGTTRDERLRRAVDAGRAVFWLEARRTLTLAWQAIARITLEHEVAIDQHALRFDPARTGCGVVPIGAVHAMQHAVYAHLH